MLETYIQYAVITSAVATPIAIITVGAFWIREKIKDRAHDRKMEKENPQLYVIRKGYQNQTENNY